MRIRFIALVVLLALVGAWKAWGPKTASSSQTNLTVTALPNPPSQSPPLTVEPTAVAQATLTTPVNAPSNQPGLQWKMLKDVGEAYMDNFGLTETDFQQMQAAKVNLIEGNFDICATDTDVKYFLDQSQAHGIKVVMPAGSGEAEWSYACNQDSYPAEQKPVWNKDAVVAWINHWKDNPTIYAWDTSNEAGSVLPNPGPDKMLTVDQLKQAYQDVKAADASRPVLIRQNGWFYYDNETDFFRAGNPFAAGVADIVMINAYSNVADYFPDFVTTVMSRSANALTSTDPKVKLMASLGVWAEKPLWVKPTVEHMNHDLDQLKSRPDLLGVAYLKYGAAGSEWYLPDGKLGAPELWEVIGKAD